MILANGRTQNALVPKNVRCTGFHALLVLVHLSAVRGYSTVQATLALTMWHKKI